jgi:hypothetical protein
VRRTVPPSAEIEAQIDRLLAVGVGESPRESLSELAKIGRYTISTSQARAEETTVQQEARRHRSPVERDRS